MFVKKKRKPKEEGKRRKKDRLPGIADGLHEVFAGEGDGAVRRRHVEGEGAAAAFAGHAAAGAAGAAAAARRVARVAARADRSKFPKQTKTAPSIIGPKYPHFSTFFPIFFHSFLDFSPFVHHLFPIFNDFQRLFPIALYKIVLLPVSQFQHGLH